MNDDNIPMSVFPTFTAGLAALQETAYDDAIVLLREAARLKPWGYFKHVCLGQACLAEGNQMNYEHSWETLASQNTEGDVGSPEAKHDTDPCTPGETLLDEAIAAFCKATRLRPSDPTGYYLLGQAYCGRDMIENAKAAMKQAMELSHNGNSYLSEVGQFYRNHEMLDEALAAFQGAVEIQPTSEAKRTRLAMAYCEAGKFDQGIATFHEALALPQEISRRYIYGGLVNAFVAQDNYEEAITALHSALRLIPNGPLSFTKPFLPHAFSPEAWYLRYLVSSPLSWPGSQLTEHGGPPPGFFDPDALSRAVPAMQQAIREQPNDFARQFRLGFAYFVLQQYEKAAAVFQTVVRLDKYDFVAFRFLAHAYFRTGEGSQALAALHEASRLCCDPGLFLSPMEVFIINPVQALHDWALDYEAWSGCSDYPMRYYREREMAHECREGKTAHSPGEENRRTSDEDCPIDDEHHERKSVGQDNDGDTHLSLSRSLSRWKVKTLNFASAAQWQDGDILSSRALIDTLGRAVNSKQLRVAVLLCDQAEHAYEKDNDASGLHSARCIRGLALKKACYLRGLARKARPKLKAAVSSFTEALSHCTQEVHTQLLPLVAEEYAVYDTDIHWERGRVYHAQGDYRNAIEDYSQVLNAEPTRLEAILNRGAAYCETREEDMGLKDFESARRLNQTVKTAWMVEHYLGSHYLKKGDLDKAVHHSSEAIQLEGKSCSYDVRAAAYEAKGSEWSEQAVADRNAASSQRLFETMGYHPVDTIPIL